MAKPNRRRVLIGTPLALLAAPANAGEVADDHAADMCKRYVVLSDQSRTLSDEWAVLESSLCRKYPGYIGMSDEEQGRLPEQPRFAEIDSERDVLEDEVEALLPAILKLKCRTPAAMMARLMVAERLIERDDHPEANKLLGASLSDLGRLLSVRTWTWASPYPPSRRTRSEA